MVFFEMTLFRIASNLTASAMQGEKGLPVGMIITLISCYIFIAITSFGVFSLYWRILRLDY